MTKEPNDKRPHDKTVRVHNLPEYNDSVAEEALRNVGDQGYADMNAAVERKTQPEPRPDPNARFSAESPEEQRQDEILLETGNYDVQTGEVGPDVKASGEQGGSREI